MRHVVYLTLDSKSSALVDAFRNEDGRKHQVCPHISLAAFENTHLEDEKDIIAATEDLATTNRQITVSFNGIGRFLSPRHVIYLVPDNTDELRTFHNDFHNAGEGRNIHSIDLYCPPIWVPHCTLWDGMDGDESVNIHDKATAFFGTLFPLASRLEAIETIRIDGDTITPICRRSLGMTI